MVIDNMSKSLAEEYKSLLSEYRPDWKVEICIEDYNLYKLGFIDYIPCSLHLDICEEDVRQLYDELIDMEIAAVIYEDLEFKPWSSMSEEEKIKYNKMIESQIIYEKYKPLLLIVNTFYGF